MEDITVEQTKNEVIVRIPKEEKYSLEELNQEIINKIYRLITSQTIRIDVLLDIYQKLNGKRKD